MGDRGRKEWWDVYRSHRHSNPLHHYYACYAAVGFIVLGFGYLIRAYFPATDGAITFFLGIFPNLAGSVATPFLLTLLLSGPRRRPDIRADWRVFALISLITVAGSWLIEMLHVVFDLGVFDRNDIVASFVGAGVAFALFILTPCMVRVNPHGAGR